MTPLNFQVLDFEDEDTNNRFQLVQLANIKLSTKPNYLIKGLLPRRGLGVIWGPPKCGKSFIAFDIAMHVALGREYRGMRVRQGGVVYLALEGGNGFPTRVEVWRQYYLDGGTDQGRVPFYLLHSVSVDLIAEHDDLIAALRAQTREPPALVFIDTLSRALNGDENSPKDMTRFIRAADAITAAFGCLTMIVHHTGWAGEHMRGHSSLAGAEDVGLAISKDTDGLITVTVVHMKDGPTIPPFGARLESSCAGSDDEGDPMISCVVIPAGARSARTPLTAKQARFMDIVREAILDAAALPLEVAQSGEKVPHDVRAVTREVLKKFCISKGWIDDEAASNAQRRQLSEMLNTLAGKGVVGLTKHFIWIVP